MKISRNYLLWTLLLIAGFSTTLFADVTSIKMEKDWGIKPVHARVTADGYMIEFRYKVIDPDKAVIMSDRKDFPSMLSMKSKARLAVPYFPTVGYVKSNRKFLHKDRNYSALFSNENRHLLRGDQVKIQVKDQISEALTLQ